MSARFGITLPRRRGHRDWAGMAAFVLALGLAVGFGVALVLVASPFTESITEPTANLLSVVGGGIVAIVAAYMARERAPEPPPDDLAPGGAPDTTPPDSGRPGPS